MNRARPFLARASCVGPQQRRCSPASPSPARWAAAPPLRQRRRWPSSRRFRHSGWPLALWRQSRHWRHGGGASTIRCWCACSTMRSAAIPRFSARGRRWPSRARWPPCRWRGACQRRAAPHPRSATMRATQIQAASVPGLMPVFRWAARWPERPDRARAAERRFGRRRAAGQDHGAGVRRRRGKGARAGPAGATRAALRLPVSCSAPRHCGWATATGVRKRVHDASQAEVEAV
jgi:hypothetical protein